MGAALPAVLERLAADAPVLVAVDDVGAVPGTLPVGLSALVRARLAGLDAEVRAALLATAAMAEPTVKLMVHAAPSPAPERELR